MGSTRRRFLTYGLGGVVLLALPSVGLGLRRSVIVEPATPLRSLTARQFSVLRAMAEVLCPGAEGLPAASELQIAEQVDALWSRMHPGVATDLGASLDLLENALAGTLLDRRTQTFTACGRAAQEAALEDWRASAIWVRRALFKALRGFIVAAYWADRRTRAWTGYPGMPDYTAVPSPPPFDEWIAGVEAAPEEAR